MTSGLGLILNLEWSPETTLQDREAQHKTVEVILAEAALANEQWAVAKAVLHAEFRRGGA
jgi:hypothetical protein